MTNGITDSSQLIDVGAIFAGCKSLRDAANVFTECSNIISSCGNKVNTLSLSVADAKKIIDDFAYSIESKAIKVYAAQMVELEEYKSKIIESARKRVEFVKNSSDNESYFYN